MSDMDRTKVTFEQAEGAEPLPSQLKPKELSKVLRARLWALMYGEIARATEDYYFKVTGTWLAILRRKHITRDGEPLDEFDASGSKQSALFKKTFMSGTYVELFGLLQWILRQHDCPRSFAGSIDDALVAAHAAYRVVDGKTIMPVASPEDAAVASAAFAAVSKPAFGGARTHLHAASEALSTGSAADAVRESMQAVESVARVITGEKTFAAALKIIETKWKVHAALKEGFNRLYGYTSDEQGIRHPLLDDPKAAVDDADALFMFGACASFVTYLINKSTSAVKSK